MPITREFNFGAFLSVIAVQAEPTLFVHVMPGPHHAPFVQKCGQSNNNHEQVTT